MNGFIRKATMACSVAAGLGSAGCCEKYNDLVDPCWPQRYNAIAREEVREPLDTQANNGLVLEQTVWNYHFKEKSPELAPAGKALLDRLARRRPAPVPDVFMQTAHDAPYNAEKLETIGIERGKLDAKRSQVVRAYLAAVRPDVPFAITVHDPGQIGMNANEAREATGRVIKGAARGTLQTEKEETRKAENTQTQEKKETKEVHTEK